MKKQNQNSRKYNGGISNKTFLIIVVVVIVVAILCAIVLPKALSKNNNNEQGEKQNYQVQDDGSKVNTSKDVEKTQEVGQVVIEKSKIVFQNGITKLTSKVTNNGPDQDNLIFVVKFIGNDGSVIAESRGLVGQISNGQVRYIDSNIIADTSNAKTITYEVLK